MMLDPIAPKVDAATDAQSTTLPPELRLQKLRGASVDFEAVLTQQMLQGMQETLQNGLVGGSGVSGSVYSSMLTESIAKSMAQNQSFGLADQLFKQVLQHEPELKEYIKTHPNEGSLHPVAPPLPGKENESCLPTISSDMIAKGRIPITSITPRTTEILINQPIELLPKADRNSKETPSIQGDEGTSSK